jgi:hypothetical protein
MTAVAEIAKPYYSPSEIACIVRESGYEADLRTFSEGHAAILSSAGGILFSIYLHSEGERRDRITTIQFSSSFGDKVTLEQVNRWNKGKRFLKAYVDDDGELCLEWDVVVSNAPAATIRECLEWWEIVLGRVDEI